jgi:hypothetical protein
VIPARLVARIGSIEMTGTGEPTRHPSPHLLFGPTGNEVEDNMNGLYSQK